MIVRFCAGDMATGLAPAILRALQFGGESIRARINSHGVTAAQERSGQVPLIGCRAGERKRGIHRLGGVFNQAIGPPYAIGTLILQRIGNPQAHVAGVRGGWWNIGFGAPQIIAHQGRIKWGWRGEGGRSCRPYWCSRDIRRGSLCRPRARRHFPRSPSAGYHWP